MLLLAESLSVMLSLVKQM